MQKIKSIFFRTIVWGIAGILFGGAFIVLIDVLERYTHNFWHAIIGAMALAGSITSSYFGAIKEAFLGSCIGLFIAIVFLMYGGEYEIKDPEIFLFVTVFIAAIAGTLFPKATILRDKPLAQAASGFISGLIGGPIVALIMQSTTIVDDHFKVALLGVALVGIFYLIIEDIIMSHCRDWMTNLFSAPFVSAISATASGCAILLLTSTDTEVTAIIDHIPSGILGGLVGSAAGGFCLALLGIGDKNDYHI